MTPSKVTAWCECGEEVSSDRVATWRSGDVLRWQVVIHCDGCGADTHVCGESLPDGRFDVTLD